jgi:hypothetical protein
MKFNLHFLAGDDMKVMENDAEWQFVTLGDQVQGLMTRF